MVLSPRLSFKGYNFLKAMYRNKTSIKAIITLITGANYFVGFEWKTFALSLAAGLVALATKLIQDAVDYFFTEVEI